MKNFALITTFVVGLLVGPSVLAGPSPLELECKLYDGSNLPASGKEPLRLGPTVSNYWAEVELQLGNVQLSGQAVSTGVGKHSVSITLKDVNHEQSAMVFGTQNGGSAFGFANFEGQRVYAVCKVTL